MKMLALLSIFIFSISAFAINGKTTYQAKIFKPDGYPLESSSVNFRFTVLDPAASCVLYVEDYAAVNMSGSRGLTSFSLGMGSVSYPTDGSVTFEKAFDNSIPSFSCQSPGIYNPIPTDNRKIVMQFDDGNGWQTLPAMAINAVPYAMFATRSQNAEKLNGKADTAFVQKATDIPTCDSGKMLYFNNASFSCIDVPAVGTSVNSVSVSGSALSITGTASDPVVTMSAVTMSNDGYLTSLDYAEFKAKLSASSTEIINTLGYEPVSSTTVNAQIASSTLAGDVSGNPGSNTVNSVGGKTSTQISTSVDDTLAATSSATASTIVKRDGSGNFTANDIYANAAKVNYVDIYKPTTSFNIRLQAHNSLSANYVLTLPQDGGSSGQVLSTDGSGNLSWINPSTGSVTSVSATAPLASTGGATPIISITQATSSTDGYLSSADWNTFNNKLSVTSAATTYVQKAGDTMTGSLNLPSNGLTVGSSQLVVSGSNVGIGVVNPFFKLTVSSPTNTWGLLQTDGAVQVGSWIGSDISGQMGGWYGTRSNHPLMFFTNNGWAQMTLTPSGNVGIGTVLATAKLHLTSGSTTVAPLKFTSGALLTSPQSGTMEYDGTNFYLTDSANTRRTIATGSSSNSIDNASTINSTSDITLNPNNGANSVIVSSTVASTSSNNGALVVKGGLGVAGTANIAGNMNVSGSSVIDGSLKLSSMTSGSVLFAGTGGTVTQDNANFFWDDVNNRLGIGTVSPADKLEVFGGALRSSRNSSQYIYLYGGDGVNQQTYLRSVSQESNKKLTVFQSFHDGAGSSAGTLGFQFQIGTSTTASTTMVIAENGYVGIGANDPQAQLHIYNSTPSKMMVQTVSTPATANESQVDLKSGSNYTRMFYRDSDNSFGIFHGASGTNVTRFRISGVSGTISLNEGGGNVGLGTTNPTEQLHIYNGSSDVFEQIETFGNQKVSGLKLKGAFGGVSATSSILFDYYGNYFGDGIGHGLNYTSGRAGFGKHIFRNASATVQMLISDAGNVGIGTTSPQAKLDISRTLANDDWNALKISNVGSWSTASNKYAQMLFTDGTNNVAGIGATFDGTYGRIDFNGFYNGGSGSTSSVVMSIRGNGNVGIGTTAPTHVLDVVDNGNDAGFKYTSFSNSYAADMRIFRARGTQAGPAALVNDDILGGVNFYGYGAATAPTARSAAIEAVATETYTASARGAALSFRVADNGTTAASERMRIASNGKVGIGTTNPGKKLDIISGNDAGLRISESASSGKGYIQLGQSLTSANNFHLGSENDGTFRLWNGSYGAGTNLMTVNASGSVGVGTSNPTHRLTIKSSGFSTTPLVLESLSGTTLISNVIDSDGDGAIEIYNKAGQASTQLRSGGHNSYLNQDGGNVGIGTTTPGYKLDVSGTINIASGSALAFGGTSVCTAAGCTSSSDERLKENIKPLDFDLNKLLSLNAVQYDWKNKSKYGDKHQIGFIAQNLEQVYPEVVYTDKNTGLKSVTYGHLVAPVIEALKSIYKRLLGLEAHVDRQIASIVESKADKAEIEVLREKAAKLESKAAKVDKLEAENAALKSYLCSKDPAAPICK